MKQQILAALEVFRGLLTPLIAIIAGYVAWQQCKTNEPSRPLRSACAHLSARHRVLQDRVP
jgi:hypothetical protein